MVDFVPTKFRILHDKSFANRQELFSVKQAACFHCLKVFNVNLIRNWEDAEQTAICPYCNIDSVIPVNKDINLHLLKRLNKYYFNLPPEFEPESKAKPPAQKNKK